MHTGLAHAYAESKKTRFKFQTPLVGRVTFTLILFSLTPFPLFSLNLTRGLASE